MKRSEINVRDPFVLPWTDGWYYLTGTRGATCWGAASGFGGYRSRDLEEWEGPFEMFGRTPDFAPAKRRSRPRRGTRCGRLPTSRPFW